MQADAERQRQKSEATLSDLQTALDSIQKQVLSVVDNSDGGTAVVKAGIPAASTSNSSPPPVYQDESPSKAPVANGSSVERATGAISSSASSSSGGSGSSNNADNGAGDKVAAGVSGRSGDA